MALRGICILTFLGWFGGVYCVSKPWGEKTCKKFTSYFHLYTLYALFINISYLLLWRDFCHEIKLHLEDKPLTMKIFVWSSSLSIHFFNCYIRLVFCILARRISELINSIGTFLTCGSSIPKDLRHTWCLFNKFFWFMLIFHTSDAVLATAFFYRLSEQNPRLDTTYFVGQERPWWYFLIVFLIGTFPTAIAVYFAFGVIFTTTFCVLAIFEDFALTLHALGRNYTGDQYKPLINDTDHVTLTVGPPSRAHSEAEISIYEDDIEARRSSVTISPSWGCMKGDLLHRFERVKELFAQYDFIVGPLILCLIVRNVFTVINAATAIIVGKNPLEKKNQIGYKYFHLLGDLAQFVILELGSWAKRRMDKWKIDLEKMVLLMRTSLEKEQLSEVVDQVRRWKWEMTACDFFHVNRQLMSGIVSTMLSYIVILFQLHVSENSYRGGPITEQFENSTEINYD